MFLLQIFESFCPFVARLYMDIVSVTAYFLQECKYTDLHVSVFCYTDLYSRGVIMMYPGSIMMVVCRSVHLISHLRII